MAGSPTGAYPLRRLNSAPADYAVSTQLNFYRKLLLNHGNRAIVNQQSLFPRKYDMSYILFTFLLFVTSSAFGQSMLMAKVSERNQVLLDGSNLLWLDPSEKFPVIGLTQEGDTIIQHSLGPIKNA